MKNIIKMLMFAFLFTTALGAYAQNNASYYKEIAKEKQLYKNEQWHNLLHYIDGKSNITSVDFFYAKNGRTNPQAEIDAEIDALFSSIGQDSNIACRFPLRTAFLIKELGIPQKDLPQIQCTSLTNYKNQVQADSAAIFYTGESARNPENLFGHLAIVINRADGSDQAFTLYFNQDVKEKDWLPIKFIKDIAGAYKGGFILDTLSNIRQQLSLTNDKDIWEYNINFTKEEMDTLVLHAWELNRISTTYSFVRYNSANAVESVLKVVKPGLKTEDLKRKTPIDILKKLNRDGIITRTAYHPSEFKQQKKGQLPQRKEAGRLDDSHPKKDIYVPIQEGEIINVPLRDDPLNAHAPTRIDIGFGYNTYRHNSFAKVIINPLVHQVIDNDNGYSGTVNLSFLAFESRYYFDDENFDFALTLAGLQSLPDVGHDLKPSLTSALSISTDKDSLDGSRAKTLAFTNNFGVTYHFLKYFNASLMAKGEAKLNNSQKGWYIGTGGIGMLTFDYNDKATTSANISVDWGTDGHTPSDSYYINAAQAIHLTKDISLFGNYKYHFTDRKTIYDAGISVYF